MSIDRDRLFEIACHAYGLAPGFGKLAIQAVIDAVLAEVAKHDTAGKPAYYRTSDRRPTPDMSEPDKAVLVWHTGSQCWVDQTIAMFLRKVDAFDYWMPMPSNPVSNEDAAFETLYASRPDSKEAKEVLKFVWDAALKFREENPVK